MSTSVFTPVTTETTELVPGQRLDRYELLVSIAQGGFGQVWLARLHGKRGFEKLVAIKVPRQTADVHFQQMLLDEARIAAAIEHDNVAKILELGEHGDILYIVMEWIDGEPVSTLLRTLDKKQKPFPLPIALRIIADMCSAAHAAHELRAADGTELGVVHRDISPQNMLITSTGTVKLIDFGIAKAKDRASGDTTDGTLKGKVKYMAPEQVVGGKIDRRADVFALGAVLHRFLAGLAPYESDNEVQTLHKLANGAERTPLPEDVPLEVRRILDKALALRVDERFATALEMHEALTVAMQVLGFNISSREIALFTHEHLKERLDRRRAAVDAAIKAAAERATRGDNGVLSSGSIAAQQALFPPPLSSTNSVAPESNSGHSNSNSNSHSHSHSRSAHSKTTGPSVESAHFALDLGPPSGIPEGMPPPAPRSKLRWVLGIPLFLCAAAAAFVAVQRPAGLPWARTPVANASVPAESAQPPPPASVVEAAPSQAPSASATAAASPAISSSASSAKTPPAKLTQHGPSTQPPTKPPANPNAGHTAKPPKPPGAPTTDFGY